jgi:BRCT domain type II-containing protein
MRRTIRTTRRSRTAKSATACRTKTRSPGYAIVHKPVTAKAIVDWAASDHGQKTLRRMHELGLNPHGKSGSAAAGDDRSPGVLGGKTFVITGTLPTLKRDEAAALIRGAGGDVTGAVSKNTSFLLAGENAGSKLDKARELGVNIITEKELLELLGNILPDPAIPHAEPQSPQKKTAFGIMPVKPKASQGSLF